LAVRTKKSVLERETLFGFRLQQGLQLGRRSPGRAKDEIPALQQRPDVREGQLREEIAQIGHRDLLVAADIDAPEEGEVDGHA